MNKTHLVLTAIAMLLCACSKEADDYIKLDPQETKQYSEAIAGSYEAKGYTELVAWKDFYNADVIGKQTDIDNITIDIYDNPEHEITFWNVPINPLANVLPEGSGARKALEECEPISFTTTYKFENVATSANGNNMVNFAFNPVAYYATSYYDGKLHQITINISPSAFYLPYTSDMKAVRDSLLKSEIRLDITSMRVDDEEYKHFDLMVVTKIAEKAE